MGEPEPAAAATVAAHPEWRHLAGALAMFRAALAIRLALLAIGLGGLTWAIAGRTVDPTGSLAAYLPLVEVAIATVMTVAMFRLVAAVPVETRALGAVVAAGIVFGFGTVLGMLEYTLLHGVPELVEPARRLRWMHAVIEVAQLAGLAILALALRNVGTALEARRLASRAQGMLIWLAVAAIATAGAHLLPGARSSTLVVSVSVLCVTMLGLLLYLALVRDLVAEVRSRVPALPAAHVVARGGAAAP